MKAGLWLYRCGSPELNTDTLQCAVQVAELPPMGNRGRDECEVYFLPSTLRAARRRFADEASSPPQRTTPMQMHGSGVRQFKVAPQTISGRALEDR